MPEGVSSERVMIIRAYGGQVRLTPRDQGILGSLNETERFAHECNAFLPRQFANLDNPEAHRVGTAREIVDQLPSGLVHAVVSGVGTGGTLVGLYQGMREAGCPVIPVLARPINIRQQPEVECCSFSGRIPGVADSLSRIFAEAELPDLQIIEVNDDLALNTARQLMRRGFPIGPSSGLNYAAAVAMAQQLEGAGNPCPTVVTVFPDRMERYFTTELFHDPS
jgi:cysteine synthase A